MSYTQIKRDLMRGSIASARDMTPFDTGNLRHNATRIENKTYGFDIVIDFTLAPYAYYLDQGMGYTTHHEGYIDAIEEAVWANANAYGQSGRNYGLVYRSAAKRVRGTEIQRLLSRDKQRIKSINRAREMFE